MKGERERERERETINRRLKSVVLYPEVDHHLLKLKVERHVLHAYLNLVIII